MPGEAMLRLLAWAADSRGVGVRGHLARLGRSLRHPVARDIDLEAFEGTAGLRGLHARVLDQYLRAFTHQPQPLQKCRRQRKRDESFRGFQPPASPVAPVVAPPPRALEFIACLLPLVK